MVALMLGGRRTDTVVATPESAAVLLALRRRRTMTGNTLTTSSPSPRCVVPPPTTDAGLASERAEETSAEEPDTIWVLPARHSPALCATVMVYTPDVTCCSLRPRRAPRLPRSSFPEAASMRAVAWSAAADVPEEKLTLVAELSCWDAGAVLRPVGMPKVEVSHEAPVKPSSHTHAVVEPLVAVTPEEVVVVSGTPSEQTVPRQLHAARQWVPQSAPNQPSRQRHCSVSVPALAAVEAMAPVSSVTVWATTSVLGAVAVPLAATRTCSATPCRQV
mmetsp:Transcript_16592/g.62809  ORF Transcript_16592/g.62809 Transcript_16592/m.62809 type:complete len:275 (-) Transcript_16592:196-1020(-)